MFFNRVIVFEHETALLFRDGRFIRELSAGRYFVWPKRDTVIRLDCRPTAITVGGQEVMTTDGGILKVSAHVQFRIVSALKYFKAGGYERSDLDAFLGTPSSIATSDSSVRGQLHVTTQLAVRDWLASRTFAVALDLRDEMRSSIWEALDKVSSNLGVEILEAKILDFTVWGNLRAAYSELLKVELEGKAALSRARNESATMRNLLNTARLIRENPGLLELRVLMANSKPKFAFTIAPGNSTDSTAPAVADEE